MELVIRIGIAVVLFLGVLTLAALVGVFIGKIEKGE